VVDAVTVDGVGMFVAAVGEQLPAAPTTGVYVAEIQSCTAGAPSPFATGPRVTVLINGTEEHTLTSVTQSLAAAIAAGPVVGRLVLVVSDSGQWVGADILVLCEGAF
jgi:hypothetical protein